MSQNIQPLDSDIMCHCHFAIISFMSHNLLYFTDQKKNVKYLFIFKNITNNDFSLKSISPTPLKYHGIETEQMIGKT